MQRWKDFQQLELVSIEAYEKLANSIIEFLEEIPLAMVDFCSKELFWNVLAGLRPALAEGIWIDEETKTDLIKFEEILKHKE